MNMSIQYGIYIVKEEIQPNGKWGGYRCTVALAEGQQGKLYLKSDGRENYQAKPKD